MLPPSARPLPHRVVAERRILRGALAGLWLAFALASVAQAQDADLDGLLDAVDPCPSEARNLCFGPVAVDGFTGNAIRLNASASSAGECSGTKTDCNGNVWLADFGFNQSGNAFACNLGGGGEGCVISGIPTLFGCDSESTEDLFQCEHWDPSDAPELSYTFDVPYGDYVVNLFFANTYSGTTQPDDRVFDILVNGSVVYDDFDQVAAAGGSGIALVRSAQVTVSGGAGLTIAFGHVVENPALKAIEVLADATPGCDVAADCDDGNACTDDVCNGGVCQNSLNTAACDDGIACTSGDACSAGVCAGANACGPGESCNTGTGLCEPPIIPGELRINLNGAALSGVDHPGLWAADPGVGGVCGPNEFTNPVAINGTVDDGLFQGEVWGNPLTCAVGAGALPPGEYDVRLYFAEIYYGPGCLSPTGGVGSRVFDVVLEGQTVLSSFDIFAEGGCAASTSDPTSAPVVKTFTLPILDGTLDISMPALADNGNLTAIEISPAAPTPCSVPADCNDANPCTDDLCTAGVCETVFNAAPCNDGIACTAADVCSLGVCSGADACPGGEVCHLATGLCGVANVSFSKSVLSGTSSVAPTTLQFGPDGRLYVGQQDGRIQVYSVVRNGPDLYAVTATETIDLIRNILNHDDDGTPRPDISWRQFTGLLVVGTPTAPVIYAGSSDPRIGGDAGGNDTGLDTNSGVLSRLTWNGSSWEKLDLVRGLTRSEENHSINGLQLDEATGTLYVTVGGHTNMGAPSNNFALTPEYALSAAILSVDLTAIGDTTYDLPTLDDEDRPGAADANDPFGGNDGKNQAMVVPGGPVQVYAPGFRNPYDLVIDPAGRMYTIDNGPNGGWGDVPVGEGPAGTCTNAVHEPGTTFGDSLHFVSGPGYYGGHPNPSRANPANTFNPSNPQSPVSTGNPVECDYRPPGGANGALAVFGSSTNGLVRYTASNFGGALQGDLLAASFSNQIQRMKLNAAGTSAVLVEALFSNVGYIPLDLTTLDDLAPFPGTIWVVNIGNGAITIFEPVDFSSCIGAYDVALDEDADGYSNADEIDNGTSPCSAADFPPDFDGDFLSDVNDPDDDNDGAPDVSDPFAIDPDNGATTQLPLVLSWDNDAPNPGGLLSLGWTGLMTNGSSDYLDLFDPSQMTAGGAAGVMTVDLVAPGDALAAANNQQYAFQVGVDVGPATGIFTVQSRILGPFGGLTPLDFQSMGIFLGTGGQDDYVKLVLAANGGAGGVLLAREIAGAYTAQPAAGVALPGPNFVDLYLEVDPGLANVTASYEVTTAGVPSGRIPLGSPESVPASWLNGSQPLAVGVISTSSGSGSPFPVTWGSFQVTAQNPSSTAAAHVGITPAGALDANTLSSDSFQVVNTSTGGQSITRLRVDLSTALLPDMVFDPAGAAGDTLGKCFSADSGGAAVGLVAPANPCVDPFQGAHDLGYDALEITFGDFGPGESFGFSVDVDPSSIRGIDAPGPNGSGGVSGLELVGATVEVEFDDGSIHTNTPFRIPGSNGGSELDAVLPKPPVPGLQILGVLASPSAVVGTSQTARVTGPPGYEVALLVVEGGLFTAGLPGGGFDLDPFEANSAVLVTEYTATLGGSGFVDVPFTLTQTGPESGIHHVVAALRDAGGLTGEVSARHVLQLAASVCGDGSVDGTETCDDGNTQSGDCCSATCELEGSGSACSDGNACTAGDACDGIGACLAGAPLACDDGAFCNGLESCDVLLGCQAGAPPALDDGVACTVDTCREQDDVVLHIPADLLCDDAAFCNGFESCDALLGCQAGAPPALDDGVGCTSDSCSELDDVVLHIPTDLLCDDTDACTADGCDALAGCLHAPIPDCEPAPAVPSLSAGGLTLVALLIAAAGAWLALRRDGRTPPARDRRSGC